MTLFTANELQRIAAAIAMPSGGSKLPKRPKPKKQRELSDETDQQQVQRNKQRADEWARTQRAFLVNEARKKKEAEELNAQRKKEAKRILDAAGPSQPHVPTPPLKPPSRRPAASSPNRVHTAELNIRGLEKEAIHVHRYDRATITNWVTQSIQHGQVPCAPRQSESPVPQLFSHIQPPPYKLADESTRDTVLQNYKDWTTPDKWRALTRLMHCDENSLFTQLGSGANNQVFQKSDALNIENPTMWPPQFRDAQDAETGLPSGARDPALRVTRKDPHEDDSSEYRSLERADMITEIALSLHMALVGIGPPIYAISNWAFRSCIDDPTSVGWGLVIAMEKGAPFDRHIVGLSQTMRQTLSERLINACYQVAKTGFVNFDTKPGNFIVQNGGHDVYEIDFDAVHMYQVDDKILTQDGRFFLNLLLLTCHFAIYSYHDFKHDFVPIVERILMSLWSALDEEYLRFKTDGQAILNYSTHKIGAATMALYNSHIKPDTDHNNLERNVLNNTKDPSVRIERHLTMMLYEYFLSSKHRKARSTVLQTHLWYKVQHFEAVRQIPFFLALSLYDHDKILPPHLNARTWPREAEFQNAWRGVHV
jgi:hypothetical protein